jgi:hypothetical protein
MIVDLSCDIFSYGTWVFVYALVHVMCLCVYVSMVCQQCMLYDDMYLHNTPYCKKNYRCFFFQVDNFTLATNLENYCFYAMLIVCKCTPLCKTWD